MAASPQSAPTNTLLEVYKVSPDGHEELIKGAELSGLTAATFRDIVAAGDLLSRRFRSADIIARLGGDEFTVFPLEAAGNSAQLLMERLAFNVDGYNEASGEPFRLSLSAGVSQFDPDSSWTIQQLLDEADRQLYESRRKRRR